MIIELGLVLLARVLSFVNGVQDNWTFSSCTLGLSQGAQPRTLKAWGDKFSPSRGRVPLRLH